MSNFGQYDENKHARAADGKFAPKSTTESDVELSPEAQALIDSIRDDIPDIASDEEISDFLDEPQRPVETAAQQRARWGEAKGIEYDKMTPTGRIQSRNEVAPGIMVYSTEGHGGVKLSPERQRAMGALAVKGADYEEDCEAALVQMRFPEAFASDDADEWDIEKVQMRAEERVKNNFPDQYEAYTGAPLRFGDSAAKDESTWASTNAGEPVIRAAWTTADGKIRVKTVPVGAASDDPRIREYEMTKEEHDEIKGMRTFGAAKVPKTFKVKDTYKDVTPPPPAPPERYRGLKNDVKLTAAQQRQVDKDLDKRWMINGKPQSLRQFIESDGLTEKFKVPHFDDDGQPTGRSTYYIAAEPESEGKKRVSFRVSKATYGIVGVPDNE